MDKPTIVFRADGNSKIGLGHFMRTLALAEMLNDQFRCVYATISPNEYQKAEIAEVCQERIDLPEGDSHFRTFLNNLKGDEIVVLDNYYFTTSYQLKIKTLGCKLVCIDDIHDKHYVADLIINHAEGIEPLVFSAEGYTRFALGYQYALLRKEYLSDIVEVEQKKYSCFLMMGGADPYDKIYKLSEMINSLNLDLPAAVVLGSNYKDAVTLEAFENIIPFRNLHPRDVLQTMQRSRIGILPASTVAIEACAVRLPFVCGYFIDNQREIYNGIQKKSLALCVGSFLEINRTTLSDALEKINEPALYKKIKQNQKKYLDKKSKERYSKLFQAL